MSETMSLYKLKMPARAYSGVDLIQPPPLTYSCRNMFRVLYCMFSYPMCPRVDIRLNNIIFVKKSVPILFRWVSLHDDACERWWHIWLIVLVSFCSYLLGRLGAGEDVYTITRAEHSYAIIWDVCDGMITTPRYKVIQNESCGIQPCKYVIFYSANVVAAHYSWC